MELRQYKAEHASDLFEVTPDRIKFAVQVEQSQFAYSVFHDGRCVGCAGIMRNFGRVWYMWAIVGDDLREHRLWLHKTVKRYLPMWLANCDWIRVEAEVAAGNRRNCRWVEALGFTLESVREKAGENGGDSLVYKMVRAE